MPRSYYYTEHLQKADQRKLKDMGANFSTVNKLWQMYMVPEGLAFFEDLGLVDFCNPEDFDVKLESLRIAWNGLLALFHNWFITHRADIIRSKLVLLAQTNSLENDH